MIHISDLCFPTQQLIPEFSGPDSTSRKTKATCQNAKLPDHKKYRPNKQQAEKKRCDSCTSLLPKTIRFCKIVQIYTTFQLLSISSELDKKTAEN